MHDGRPILLVDDSEAERFLMQIHLADVASRRKIDCAIHGLDALDYLHRRGGFANREGPEPSLILMDNKMPVMGGMEATAEIRRSPRFASLPIVMWSNSADPEDIRRAHASGVTSYLVKPSNAASNREVLLLVARYWTELNTLPEPLRAIGQAG